MGITKREYDAVDAAPVVLYGKKDDTQTVCYPIVIGPRSQTPTGSAIQVQIGPGDVISNIPIFMDYEHHQVHEGESFLAEFEDTGLDTNTIKFAINVPTKVPANATTCPHMVISCDVYNGAAKVSLYEAAAITGGTTLISYNRERNVATTAATTLLHSVTSATGTLIKAFYAGTGLRTSGISRSDTEMVLKSNTSYRVDVTGLAAGTDVIVGFHWYEDLGV